jgi:hypothetical protein
MALRVLIGTQVVWVVFLGMVCQGVITVPGFEAFPGWCGDLVALVVGLPLYVFPVLVIWALWRKRATAGTVVAILAIEAFLTFAYIWVVTPPIH